MVVSITMKLKVLCLWMKLRIARTVGGGEQSMGNRCLYSSMKCFTALTPSLVGFLCIGTRHQLLLRMHWLGRVRVFR